MATTANDQINGALRLLGVLAEGETPSAATSQDALVALNQMIDSWNTERLAVFSTQDQVFSWPPGFYERTLGPTGNFVGNRPILVEDSTYFKDPASGISYGLKLINQQQYNPQMGGLSAVRRMRGNLLHMTTQSLLRDSGVHEGRDLPFFNYMKALTSNKVTNSQQVLPARLGDWLRGYSPKNRTGRLAVVHDLSIDDDKTEINSFIVKDILLPLISHQERILLCGTSHGSIDEVLMGLLSCGDSDEKMIERITRIASKPEDLVEKVRDSFMLPQDWLTRIDEIERSRVMFACTVKAVHHDILSRGDFGVAIVLGADRIPDAALWGVMIRARQVLLVGNVDKQLGEGDSEDNYLFRRLVKHRTCPIIDIGGQETQMPIVELD